MPDLARQGPFSYDSLSRTGNGEYTLDKSDFNADNGEILEVIVNGVKIEGDGSVANATDAGNKDPAHGFYVDSLTDPTKITLVSNPGSGTIKIYRLSNRSTASVDFAPGSVIREQDLDNSTSQTLHVAQEAIDIALNGVVLATDDKWDANSKVIKSVADGSATNDAVNKGQLITHDTTITGYMQNAEDYKNTAISYATKDDGFSQTYSSDTPSNTSDHSSKAWAVGGTGVTTTNLKGASKEWATATGLVDTASYSSKTYAQSATAGTSTYGGSAKGWASTAYDTAVPGAGANDRSALHYSTDASNSATAAKNSAAAVAQDYDNFSDVYLGSMRTDKISADGVTLTGASWAKDSSEIAFSGISSGTVTIGQELTSTGSGYPVGANIIGTQTTTPLVISNPFTVAGTGATLVFVGSGVYGAYSSGVGGPSLNNDGDALVNGNLYFNSQENEMRIWQGAEWIAATAVGQSSLLEYKFVTTSGQVSSKTYSGTADVGGTLSYTQNNIIVFMNGVQLKDTTDYTATNGSSVVLVNAPAENDEINIIAFKSFTTADMVSASNGGTFSSAVTFGAGLVANTADINGGTVDGVTIGTNSACTDLRVDNIKIDGNAIISTDTNGNIDLTPNGTGEVNISKVDIDAGTIDGATITVGSGKTLDVSAGTLTTSTTQKQTISSTAFASGTKMIFNQTAAPTGWTKVTGSGNDTALRVTTGTVGTGGSVAFETAFASQTPTISTPTITMSNAAHTLTLSQIPSHAHSQRFFPQGSSYNTSYPGLPGHSGGSTTSGEATASSGGGGSHTHSNTASSSTPTSSAINLDVSYVDVIIATKD